MTSRRTFQRGKSETQFPGKLHDLMDYVEQHGLQSAISWIRNGTGIVIRDPEELVHIVSRFFGRHIKYRSFRRQLNMWHFQRIPTGPDHGGFMHPFFVKNKKPLCAFMSRYINPEAFQPSPLSLDARIQNSSREGRGGSSFSSPMLSGSRDNLCLDDSPSSSHIWFDVEDEDLRVSAKIFSTPIDSIAPGPCVLGGPLFGGEEPCSTTLDFKSAFLLPGMGNPASPETVKIVFEDLQGDWKFVPRMSS